MNITVTGTGNVGGGLAGGWQKRSKRSPRSAERERCLVRRRRRDRRSVRRYRRRPWQVICPAGMVTIDAVGVPGAACLETRW